MKLHYSSDKMRILAAYNAKKKNLECEGAKIIIRQDLLIDMLQRRRSFINVCPQLIAKNIRFKMQHPPCGSPSSTKITPLMTRMKPGRCWRRLPNQQNNYQVVRTEDPQRCCCPDDGRTHFSFPLSLPFSPFIQDS